MTTAVVEATDALITGYLPEVRRIANYLNQSAPLTGVDDLYQEGCLALVRMAGSYDGRGEFGAYVYPRVRGAMLNYMTQEVSAQTLSLDILIDRDPLLNKLESREPGPGEQVERQEEMASRLEWLVTLPVREREIIVRHGHGESMGDIAFALGLTRQRVSQLHAQGMSRLPA